MFHLPRTRNDLLLFTVFWLGGLFTLFYEYCIVLASYHDSWNGYVTFHIIMSGFLAVMIYVNMLMLITSDVSANSVVVPNGEPPKGWKYCDKCQRNAPPRSHHCKFCNECILKRDHHCWFAGYCVGYNNHRYFFCLAFYMSLAGIYANVYNWEFFMKVKGGLAWSTLPVTQIIQLCTGQVQYERKKKILDYSRGIKNTYREIFGTAGLWILVCPLIPTTLPGDGTSFETREKKTT
ncbi:hypothetical protein Btru_057802 [Bulinus truncatus]|nr:hypothetical protein Btru_057802 [Bulinus truncatus]